MSLFRKKAVVLMLTAVASLGALNAYAAKATTNAAAPIKVSMLAGKFSFTLPKGFVANPLPPGATGATGTMYANETTKTVVIAAENNLQPGVTVKDNDGDFLDSTAADFDAAEHKNLPDFVKLSEKSLTMRSTGLGVRQVSSTATQGGGKTLNTTLMAGSGNRMAVIQIISRPDDKAGHDTLVSQITGK